MNGRSARDLALQSTVHDELEWTPDIDPARIGVAAEDGVVSLSGEVESFGQRRAAREATLRVRGVTAVVDDLTVHPRNGWEATETDIAKEIERALRRRSDVPSSVRATVIGHDVTLSGEVDWEYQRVSSERVVEQLRGVGSVANLITLTQRPSAAGTADGIRAAFVRNAQIDANNIHVETSGTTVTLTGRVRSYAERVQARSAAWASPHVTEVIDHIIVRG